MSDTQDDPLLGLLTDIAEGVATLAARIDGIETRMAAQNDVTNEALATIAEIATRTYYASKSPKGLPDAVINSAVSIYYYFKVVVAMYFTKEENEYEIITPDNVRWILLAGVAILAVLSVFPGQVFGLLK